MAFKGRAKRNYNRTYRYGNWRQLYYDALGICQECKEAVDNLEIHEETDDISVISWKLVCRDCHIKVIHKEEHYNGLIIRRYDSKLSDDINEEITEYGGLEAWIKSFNINRRL